LLYHINQNRVFSSGLLVMIFTSIFLCMISVPLKAQENSTNTVKKVVIDAGHGGHDPGCHGAAHNEKEVCLSIALKLGKLIEQRLPAVEVIYTRKTDIFVDLIDRAKIANKNDADLFICIHANSAHPKAYGSETYVMGLHKTESNLNVAKRENSVILLEDNYQKTYEGFDPNSAEDIIAMTLMQSIHLNQSLKMATNIQTNFEKSGRRNRGVKQAGFLVLHQTAMPAVLIESGFLTNKEEEAYLSEPASQLNIAEDIYKAFVSYKASIESIEKISIEDNKKALELNKKDTAVKLVKPIEIQTPTETPKVTFQDSTRSKESKNTNTNNKKNANAPIIYRVQIKTAPTPLPIESKNFFGMTNVYEYQDSDGLYKYTVGQSNTINELVFLQKTMRNKGSKGAFITAFQENKRISLKQAKALSQKK